MPQPNTMVHSISTKHFDLFVILTVSYKDAVVSFISFNILSLMLYCLNTNSTIK
jgi:hypothetical protein